MPNNSHKNQDIGYFFEAVVQFSQDSIVTIDLNRLVTSWNKGAENLYGYPAHEVVGKSLDVIMLPTEIFQLIQYFERIKHNVVVPIYETVRLHKGGRELDLQIALSPVRNLTGELIGISIIARDMTVAKHHEHMRDDFIVVASHELATPITSIKAYNEILIEHFENKADSDSLSLVTKLSLQIDRLLALIKKFLDTSRMSAGKLNLNPDFFDLSLLIQEQTELIQQVSPRHQISFKGQKGQFIVADRKLIGQVLTNLLSNATKYSPGGGMVIIDTVVNDNEAQISVQDFGIGIRDGVDKKIFERYFRVEGQQTSTIPGMGLGLYITAQIVRQHGGNIHMESSEGVGTTFTFSLPQKLRIKSSIPTTE